MWQPFSRGIPESLSALTIAFLAIGQERRDDDLPSLSRTHAQQPLIHALDQPAGADVGVISAAPTIAAENEVEVMLPEMGEAGWALDTIPILHSPQGPRTPFSPYLVSKAVPSSSVPL